jgi:hypothetical protein
MLHAMQVKADQAGFLSRRSFLRSAASGTAGMLGFNALQAAEMKKRGMSCILLWMAGGPSQYESFDPKPGHECMGPTKTIDTAVPGLKMAEGWPHMSKMVNDISIIRSMTSIEPDHPRASFHLHTGYLAGGGVKYPTFGASAAAELSKTRPADFELPHFVAIGKDNHPARKIGAGFLSQSFAPLPVTDPAQLPTNIALPEKTSPERFERQLDLMKRLEAEYAEAGNKQIVEDHRAVYEAAKRLALSPRLKAFDINQEPQKTRDRYGDTPFGKACLLARRLVQEGIPFIEVQSFHPKASAAWDTHLRNFEVTKYLVEWADPAWAALLTDLKEMGLLENTLVIWMGEFGRTAKINKDAGRDHQHKAWTLALSGGGVKSGRIIGETSADGTEVKSRPVTVPDLFRTFCHSLKIDADKENDTPVGRPIKIVDGGAPVLELF